MLKTTQKALDDALRASITKEMTKPRISKSAREGQIFLAQARKARLHPHSGHSSPHMPRPLR